MAASMIVGSRIDVQLCRTVRVWQTAKGTIQSCARRLQRRSPPNTLSWSVAWPPLVAGPSSCDVQSGDALLQIPSVWSTVEPLTFTIPSYTPVAIF